MSNTLLKNFNICFSKLKCLPPFLPPPPNSPPSPHNHHNTTITTSTLIKNYNSIYDHTSQDYLPFSTTTMDASDDDSSSSTPDLASLYASQRFFFSSPGRSNSIIDSSSFLSSTSSSLPETETATEPLIGSSAGGVAIHKYSPDPYADFRRSMQEMLEARRFGDMESEWEYLHELLLCYLTLNPKHTHKFIIGAFCDLVVGLVSPPENDRRRRARGRRHQRAVTRRLLL